MAFHDTRVHTYMYIHTCEVVKNHVLFNLCRNLPFEITTEEMYDIFGKYGAIRQIRL